MYAVTLFTFRRELWEWGSGEESKEKWWQMRLLVKGAEESGCNKGTQFSLIPRKQANSWSFYELDQILYLRQRWLRHRHRNGHLHREVWRRDWRYYFVGPNDDSSDVVCIFDGSGKDSPSASGESLCRSDRYAVSTTRVTRRYLRYQPVLPSHLEGVSREDGEAFQQHCSHFYYSLYLLRRVVRGCPPDNLARDRRKRARSSHLAFFVDNHGGVCRRRCDAVLVPPSDPEGHQEGGVVHPLSPRPCCHVLHLYQQLVEFKRSRVVCGSLFRLPGHFQHIDRLRQFDAGSIGVDGCGGSDDYWRMRVCVVRRAEL